MRRYQSLLALNVSVFLLMVGVGMIVALLPQRIMDLSRSVATVGYLAAAFALSYVLLQVPMGRLADQVGCKLPLLVGYGLCGITGLLYYRADTTTLIFLGRFLQGMGEVPIWALAPALLSLYYPTMKGRAIGLYNASFHFGLSVGPLLGLLLRQVGMPTNTAFLLYAGVSFMGALIIYLFVEEPQALSVVNADPVDVSNIRQLVTNRLTLVVLLGIALYGAGYGVAVTLIPAFLLAAKDFDQAALSIFFALFYIAISLAQLMAGPFSDKQGRQRFMVGGLVLAAMGLAWFSTFPQPWLNGALALVGLGLGLFCVASLAYLHECVSDADKGTISGAYYLFWGLGYFLGPLATGVIGNLLGLPLGFYLLAGLLGLEALLLLMVWRN